MILFNIYTPIAIQEINISIKLISGDRCTTKTKINTLKKEISLHNFSMGNFIHFQIGEYLQKMLGLPVNYFSDNFIFHFLDQKKGGKKL
jgi:hypothetical protein